MAEVVGGKEGVRSETRLPALDGLRGIAILLVMQFHFWGAGFSLAGAPTLNRFDRELNKVFDVGWIGVDLFFVLSGFLITGILLDARGSAGFFRTFYARRGLRIFPLYFGFLLFAVALLPVIERFDGASTPRLGEGQIWMWLFLHNVAFAVKQIAVDVPGSFGHMWSLAVEEQFYLVWPLLMLVVPRDRVGAVCLAVAAGALIFRLAVSEGLTDAFLKRAAATYTLMPARADGLALGGLVAVAARDGWLRRICRLAPLTIAASSGFLVLLFFTRGGLSVFDRYVQTFGMTATAILFVSVTALAVAPGRGALARVLELPALGWVGRYSYAMYMFHVLVLWKLVLYAGHFDLIQEVYGWQLPSNIAFSLIATAATMVLAYGSWHLYEKHFLKLKDAFRYGAEPRREAAPVPAPATVPQIVGIQPDGSANG